MAQLSQFRQPFQRGHVDPALALDGLHDYCSDRVQPGTAVLQQGLNPWRTRLSAVQATAERDRNGMRQGYSGAVAVESAAGDCKRAERHAVEAAGERNHLSATSGFTGQLERCLHRVRPAWARELHPVAQLPGFEDEFVE